MLLVVLMLTWRNILQIQFNNNVKFFFNLENLELSYKGHKTGQLRVSIRYSPSNSSGWGSSNGSSSGGQGQSNGSGWGNTNVQPNNQQNYSGWQMPNNMQNQQRSYS